MRIHQLIGAFAVTASLVLAACGGDNSAPSPAVPGSSAAASKPAPASSAAAASPPATSAAASAPATASSASSAAAPATGKIAKIGAALSITGTGGPFGPYQKNGITLAMDEINKAGGAGGYQLAIDIQDDASDKTQGINVFQKFIKDNDVAIIGPTLSNTAFASDPEAQKAKIPVLAVSNTADGIPDQGDYIFRDSLAEFQVIPNTVKVTQQKLGLKKVAVMYANDDAFSKSSYDNFVKSLKSAQIDVTDTESFGSKDTDFTAQLTKVKGTNPDAIVVCALVDAGANITAQARKLGIPDTVRIIGNNGFNSVQIAKIAGPAATGVIVGAAWINSSSNPTSQKFVADYKARFNQDADQFAAQAYAGTYILADAIKRASLSGDTAKDRDGIRQALTQTKDLPTVLGSFSFLPSRDANHPPVVQEVDKNGNFLLYQ